MKSLRVMIVEDEPLIALLLAEMLTAMGHEVCGSERTEADAVTTALRLSPELMIVDACLHEGSGISAVEEILHAGFVAHIFMSGAHLSEETFHPQAVSIRKPFFEADLIRAIEKATAIVFCSKQTEEPFGGPLRSEG